jgi:serine/threonine protein kinase
VAEVLRARRELTNTVEICAVKRLLPQHRDNAEWRTRLLDEYTITSRLKHPHIVQVFELFELEGTPHLAMEYLDGISVDRLIVRGLKGHFIPVRVTGAVALALLDALQFAHAAGVVHRDVSASNITLSAAGQIKLMDFGIADAEGRLSSTAPGFVVGKEGYLSEQRLQGQRAGAADDLYALGIVLERMLAAGDPRERARTETAAIRGLRELLGTATRTENAVLEKRISSLKAGIRGATAEEIATFLQSPPPSSRMNVGASQLHEALDGTTADGSSGVADANRHRRQTLGRKR